jgi:hypothetical protein
MFGKLMDMMKSGEPTSSSRDNTSSSDSSGSSSSSREDNRRLLLLALLLQCQALFVPMLGPSSRHTSLVVLVVIVLLRPVSGPSLLHLRLGQQWHYL